ncbi:HGxxPAAW family protein [Arthrobacter sp. H35-D1]|uniref:HGxxPAAW family protein n=1 Tax=Arthrobacter sp. H35-D1 TaxID=3046202 RepID=UPI0024BB36CD|nr:HGxxPAAW family protein [Arthrobacter sp. H35-D1]MDJ0314688.1 HGxxPAAW family protein [Arthrobacter sp. H35-D1]
MSNKSAADVSVQGPIDHSIELGHGNSPAAWTSVAIMLVGTIVGCIAFLIGESATLLFWIGGVGIIAVGLIAGGVMKAAGYGVGGSKLKNNGH